jgi:hypothetical protein
MDSEKLFQTMEQAAEIAAMLGGFRKKLLDAGFSEDAAEHIVVGALFANQDR